jgi:hypothetical protein
MTDMRLTEFWERMGEAFGPTYADSLARDQTLSALGGRTVMEALAAGEPAKDVWRVVAEQFNLPAKLR